MARPVDAEALEKKISEWLGQPGNGDYYSGYDAALCAVQDLIADMPALTPPNEALTLISMSDEIPPDNERVLVYRPCMVDSDTGPYSVQWGWAAKRDGSHWARLPDRRQTAEEMEKLEGME